MLSIKIDGKPVEISKDLSITMNLKSPIFNEPGSYSYPFKMPNTPRNNIALGFRHRIPNTGDIFHEFQGSLYWKGITLFTGTMKIRVASDKGYEGYLMEGKGDWNYLRKKNTLQDVDFGLMEWTWEELRRNYINSCKGKVYPEVNMAFPQILNKSYFDELPTDPRFLNFNYYEDGQIGAYFPNQTQQGVIVPMLFLRYVLKKIFENLRYGFDDQFFTADSDYNSLALFNAVDCNSGPEGYFGYSKIQILNNYHVPRMGMNDFFTGLESFFNLRMFVNSTTRIVQLKSVDKIVKEEDYIEFSDRIISITTEPEDKVTGYHLRMEMDTDDEFYTAAKEGQETLLDHIKPPVESVSDLKPWPSSDVYETRFVINENKFYILWSNKVWTPVVQMSSIWTMFSECIYKDTDQSIDTKFSTLYSNTAYPNDGVVGCNRNDWKDTSPKLFFVSHFLNSVNDRVIARCFTDRNNLSYVGEYGLLNKHYKAFFDFRMTTKLVKVEKIMNFSEIKDFDFSRKYMINGIKYLVKNIQVVFKRDRIMPAVLECYPLNSPE